MPRQPARIGPCRLTRFRTPRPLYSAKPRLRRIDQPRAARLESFLRQYAEGASLQGRSFVLVEDVVSSGGALIDSLSMLKADGLWPVGILCVIDRQSGGKEALAEVGHELKSLFTYSQIIGESNEGSAE